jgi:DNA-directed RNA polymerase subunit RPC12/RpoP
MKRITVAVFDEPLQAHLARMRLEREGIPCVLENENTVSMIWTYSMMVGGIRLQVGESDAERAVAVLGEKPPPAEGPAGDEEEKQTAVRCPSCNGRDLVFEKWSRRWMWTFVALLGFPVPVRKNCWRCRTCGTEWKDESWGRAT